MWKSILTAKILRKQAKLSHIPSHKIQFLRRLTNKLNSKENFDIYKSSLPTHQIQNNCWIPRKCIAGGQNQASFMSQ